MRQIKSLTSLRFFAAFAVVCEHYFGFSFGHLGVAFFYVLSGYVLAYIYDARFEARAFFVRRFARIYPAHVLVYLICLPYFVTTSLAFHHGAVPIIGGALANLFLLHSWIPIKGAYFGFGAGSWSLSDEAFFYATFPLWRKIKRLWTVAAALLAIIAAAMLALPDSQWLFYINPTFRLLEFLVGILCFRLTMKGGTGMELLAVGSMAAAVAVSYWLPQKLTWSLVFIIPSALIVSTFAKEEGAVSRAIRGPFLVELGEASYALYLLHATVLRLLERFVGDSSVIRAAIAGLVIVLSVLGHRFYERPLRRWIIARLGGAPRKRKPRAPEPLGPARPAETSVDG